MMMEAALRCGISCFGYAYEGRGDDDNDGGGDAMAVTFLEDNDAGGDSHGDFNGVGDDYGVGDK